MISKFNRFWYNVPFIFKLSIQNVYINNNFIGTANYAHYLHVNFQNIFFFYLQNTNVGIIFWWKIYFRHVDTDSSRCISKRSRFDDPATAGAKRAWIYQLSRTICHRIHQTPWRIQSRPKQLPLMFATWNSRLRSKVFHPRERVGNPAPPTGGKVRSESSRLAARPCVVVQTDACWKD